MWSRAFLVAVVGLLITSYGYSFSESYVKNLEIEYFSQSIRDGKWVLFFCETSPKKNAEMYSNIEYIAAKYHDDFGVGYVDCSTQQLLCQKNNVAYYPNVKYSINGILHDYYGRTSLRSLMEMSDSLMKDSIIVVHDEEELKSFIAASPVVFLLVYDDNESGKALYDLFYNASQHLQLYSTFGATNQKLSFLPPVSTPYVMRVEGDEDILYYRLEEEMPLMEWVAGNTLPLLPEYRGRAYSAIIRSNKYTLLFALKSDLLLDNAELNRIKQIIRSFPNSIKRVFAFAYLDGNEWDEYLENFSVYPDDLPCAVVLHERSGKYYHSVRIDEKSILHYINGIHDNTISPVASSSIRYGVDKFFVFFYRLPFASRVFISVSFTFALAILTLKVIFFFTEPGKAKKD